MFAPSPTAPELLARLETVMDELLQLDRTLLSGPELLELLRAVETQTRRLAAVDVANLAEIESRHVAADVRCRDTAALLVDMLHVDPAQARQRVHLAQDLGGKTALSGERLPASFPAVADALGEGTISASHAQRISDFFDHIPSAIAESCGDLLQQQLLEVAQQTTPRNLAKFCEQLAARLDPDGPEPRDPDRQRRRHFTVATAADGWSRVTGTFSPELTATVNALLDELAAPQPAEDGTPDERTPAQRRHDALLDAGQRLLRGEGVSSATILVTVDETQLRERVGFGTTAHGDLMPIADVLRLAADAGIIPVVLNDAGGVVAYGRTRRLASAEQRRALAARDKGCSFPGCSAPPDWCQAHHVIEWHDGGSTDLDNTTLLCGHHHRQHKRQGWTCQMVPPSSGDGVNSGSVPWWTPPQWIDPDRTPRRNHAHA